MTPKEKAEELVARYDVLQTFIDNFNKHHAKECALIAVDEMIEQQQYQNKNMMWSCVLYWKEVKKEINKI